MRGDQVFRHVDVTAGKGLDETGDVIASLHRERGQLQTGNPTLRSSMPSLELPARGSKQQESVGNRTHSRLPHGTGDRFEE